MKINYFGIVAVVIALASLASSWFSITANSVDQSSHMSFTAYLYQIQGSVNGIPATAFPAIWFVMAALALTIVAAFGCLTGSFLLGRKGQLLLLMAGISALLSIVVFDTGLLNSEYANSTLVPGAIMKLFASHAFGQTTAEVTVQRAYDVTWSLSYGFWMAIVTAIMAFVGALALLLIAKKNRYPAKSAGMSKNA